MTHLYLFCISCTNTHIHTHTHTHTTVLRLSGFSAGQPGRAGKKHSPTHTIVPYLLPPSITIHGPWYPHCSIYVPESLSHNLSPSFLCSTSWPGTLNFVHFFIQSLSSFRSTCPYHHNLFCCSTEITSSNPSLSQPFTWNSIL